MWGNTEEYSRQNNPGAASAGFYWILTVRDTFPIRQQWVTLVTRCTSEMKQIKRFQLVVLANQSLSIKKN